MDGLGTFGQRVLFARVRPETESGLDRFAELLEAVRARLAAASAAIEVSDKFDFTPHLTLCKVRTKGMGFALILILARKNGLQNVINITQAGLV